MSTTVGHIPEPAAIKAKAVENTAKAISKDVADKKTTRKKKVEE